MILWFEFYKHFYVDLVFSWPWVFGAQKIRTPLLSVVTQVVFRGRKGYVRALKALMALAIPTGVSCHPCPWPTAWGHQSLLQWCCWIAQLCPTHPIPGFISLPTRICISCLMLKKMWENKCSTRWLRTQGLSNSLIVKRSTISPFCYFCCTLSSVSVRDTPKQSFWTLNTYT